MKKKTTLSNNSTYVQRNWLRVSDPGSFTGVDSFVKAKRYLNKNNILKSLQELDAFTKHKVARKRFKRRALIVRDLDEVWSVDLVQMTQYPAGANRNFKFILAIVDCLSKYTWMQAIKDKSSNSVLNGFKSVFKSTKRRPKLIWSDQVQDIGCLL